MVKIRNSKGKVTGIINNRVFTRKLSKSKHFFRKHNGWGTDCDALQQAKLAGATIVEIIDSDDKSIYRLPIDAFDEGDGEIIDYGYGVQIVMRIDYWDVSQGVSNG